MPEPVEMPNIEAIVESIRVARRSEEGARMHIAVSVQVKDAPQLLPFLATSLKNVIKVGFMEIQARLPENPPKVETVTLATTVDGAEANVVLPKTRRNSGTQPHAFDANPENASKCLKCKRGPQHEAHSEEKLAAQQVAQERAALTPHVFDGAMNGNEADTACYVCGRGLFDKMPDGETGVHSGQEPYDAEALAAVQEAYDAAAASQNGNHADEALPDAAQALIDEASRVPA